MKVSDKELLRLDGVINRYSFRDDGHVMVRKGTTGWRVNNKISDEVDLRAVLELQWLEQIRMDEEFPNSAKFREVFHSIVPFEHREWAFEAVSSASSVDDLYQLLTDGWPSVPVRQAQCALLLALAELADVEQRVLQ